MSRGKWRALFVAAFGKNCIRFPLLRLQANVKKKKKKKKKKNSEKGKHILISNSYQAGYVCARWLFDGGGVEIEFVFAHTSCSFISSLS